MKRTSKVAFVVWVVLATTGMIPSWVAASGKKYSHLVNRSTTVDVVRAELGVPAWKGLYQPEVEIRRTAEYVAYKEQNGLEPYVRGPCAGSGEFGADCRTASVEVYEIKGRLHDLARGQGYGMVHGMTFGIAGVFFLPSAIMDRIESADRTSYLTFWYDSNKKVVGVFEGNLWTESGTGPRPNSALLGDADRRTRGR
jgi:hypothetical protein